MPAGRPVSLTARAVVWRPLPAYSNLSHAARLRPTGRPGRLASLTARQTTGPMLSVWLRRGRLKASFAWPAQGCGLLLMHNLQVRMPSSKSALLFGAQPGGQTQVGPSRQPGEAARPPRLLQPTCAKYCSRVCASFSPFSFGFEFGFLLAAAAASEQRASEQKQGGEDE